MTGLPEHNFPAFCDAAERLHGAGWDVVNSADNFGGRTDLSRARYLRMDAALLLQCDALALLPEWEDSEGARLECLLAVELGLPVIDAETGALLDPPPRVITLAVSTEAIRGGFANRQERPEGVLDEAAQLTSGARHGDYGHPRDDFVRTARMWSGVLASKLRPGAEIDAMDVPLCMIAVKLARQAYRHKRDNLVDVAGYARTAAMVAGDE